MVMLAVNVTFVPAQIGITGLETILMVGVNNGFTTIAILLDVTFAGVAHGASEVKITVTTSPLFKLNDENVFEFVPTFIPLICH